VQDRGKIEARHFNPQHFPAGDKRSSFSAGGANPNLRELDRPFTRMQYSFQLIEENPS
jgi:hypothetical protein